MRQKIAGNVFIKARWEFKMHLLKNRWELKMYLFQRAVAFVSIPTVRLQSQRHYAGASGQSFPHPTSKSVDLLSEPGPGRTIFRKET